jgi:hypothetical protein
MRKPRPPGSGLFLFRLLIYRARAASHSRFAPSDMPILRGDNWTTFGPSPLLRMRRPVAAENEFQFVPLPEGQDAIVGLPEAATFLLLLVLSDFGCHARAPLRGRARGEKTKCQRAPPLWGSPAHLEQNQIEGSAERGPRMIKPRPEACIAAECIWPKTSPV